MKCLVCIGKAFFLEQGTRRPFCKDSCQKVYHAPPHIDRSIFDEAPVLIPDIFNVILSQSYQTEHGWFGIATMLNDTDDIQRLETMLRWIFARPDNVWTRVWKIACLNGMDRLVDYMMRFRRPSQNLLNRSLVWVTEGTGDVNVAARLLIAGADPSANMSRSLKYATFENYIELVRLLLADGRADPNVDNVMIVQNVIGHNDIEMIRLLFEDGRVRPSTAAIIYATDSRRYEILDMLLDYMINKNLIDEDNLRRLKGEALAPEAGEIFRKYINKLQRKEAGDQAPTKRLKDPIF
jgi:hypothetical protein